MAFRLRYDTPGRIDAKSLAGFVGIIEESNPGLLPPGPTGPSGGLIDVITDLTITNNLTGNTSSFTSIKVNDLTGGILSSNSFNSISSNNYTTKIISSSGMSGDSTFSLPPSIPDFTKSYMVCDNTGNLSLDPLLSPVSNLKIVSKYPIIGQFFEC